MGILRENEINKKLEKLDKIKKASRWGCVKSEPWLANWRNVNSCKLQTVNFTKEDPASVSCEYMLKAWLVDTGDDYRQHITCVSEAQKYGGKDYVESSSAQKGQKKQDAWIQKVTSPCVNYPALRYRDIVS